jgi:hypothetical protein
LKTIALLIGSVVFFAVADFATLGVNRSSGDPWSDYLVWAISIGLAVWGVATWVKGSTKPTWLVAVGSVGAVSAVLTSNIVVGVLISCSIGQVCP